MPVKKKEEPIDLKSIDGDKEVQEFKDLIDKKLKQLEE